MSSKKMTQLPKIGRFCKVKMSLNTQRIIKERKGRAVNFIMALSALENGKKITKISWNEENSYIFCEDGLLKHNKPYFKGQRKYGSGYPYVMSDRDIINDDWIVID